MRKNNTNYWIDFENYKIIKGMRIKIWVDDLRNVPEGFIGTKSVDETIALIEYIEDIGAIVELLDLDHDLGDYAQYGGDAIKILDYLAEKNYSILLLYTLQILLEEKI